MRLNFCYASWELDFTLELPTISFSFGPFVDEEPEAEVVPDRRGDSLSMPIGFTRSASPEWDAPGSYHQFDPDETSEDY